MMTQAVITPQKNPWTWSSVMLLILVVPVQGDQQSHHAQEPESPQYSVGATHRRIPLTSWTRRPKPQRITRHNTIKTAMATTHHP